jgi:hypothetical protein
MPPRRMSLDVTSASSEQMRVNSRSPDISSKTAGHQQREERGDTVLSLQARG